MKHKPNKPGIEDYILMISVSIVIMLLVAWLLSGCASKQAKKMQMIWLDSECFLYIDGMQAEQAEELQRDWSLERCDVAVQSRAGKEEPPPEGEG